MPRGHPKPVAPSTKLARGTYQPYRDAHRIEVVTPSDPPAMPDWLTAAGREIWLDDVGRVALAGETDSTAFANYCNLAGAIALAWRSGEVPPAAYLAECRRLAEAFGIAGARSRVMTRPPGSTSADNPFHRNVRRAEGSA